MPFQNREGSGWARLLAGRRTKKDEVRPSATLEPDVGKEGRRSPLRGLYDDIGNFLFENKLDLTPLNFGCTHDYLCGYDQNIVHDFDKAGRDGLISNGWIEDYVAAHRASVVTSAALEAMIGSVEHELKSCAENIDSVATKTESFGNALDDCTTQENSHALTQRLMTLTREMIVQTRLAETELRASHGRINDLQSTLKAARRASKTDPLTGLNNRRGFERSVKQTLADGNRRPMIVAICDLDHFKSINDRFGHETGDRVLCHFARELKRLTLTGHEVARLGGEEFGILLINESLESAAKIIHKVRKIMASRNLRDRTTDQPIGAVTFSAGVASMTPAGGLSEALRDADAALYAAKRGGRNQISACTGKAPSRRCECP